MLSLAEEAFHEFVPEEQRGPTGTARVSSFMSTVRAGFPTRVSLMRTSTMARTGSLEAWVRDIEGTAALAGKGGAPADTSTGDQRDRGEGDNAGVV